VGWRRARRRFKRWLAQGGRFYLAFAFTIFVVSYVAVPFVARFLDAAGDYNPIYYEPKDFARQDYLERHSAVTTGLMSWENFFKLALVIAVGVVWRALVPSRSPDRTSSRR
jgi:hypothetical protein